MKYVISDAENGLSVKDVLRRGAGLSMAFIKRLKFLDNGILLNGTHVTVRHTVQAGDVLTLATEDTELGESLTPTDISLDIVYEDDYIVLPSKPPFMPTHPSHLHHGDTLADALAYRYRDEDIPFVFRPINRLDRNTSGITLIARDRISAATLTRAMRDGLIKKQYVAVLQGELPEDRGTIETYIRRTERSIIVRENCDADGGGDYALTHYRVIARASGHTVVLASPITGRTHQLRVHFAGLGCPILGDDMYGQTSELIPRHALHAMSLKLPHPHSGEELSLTAPLPHDITSVINSIFGDISPRILDSSDDM